MWTKTATAFLKFYLCFCLPFTVFSQEPGLQVIVEKLSAKNDFSTGNFFSVFSDLRQKDSTYVYTTIERLEKYLPADPYFNARFHMLKCAMDRHFRPNESKAVFRYHANLATNEAYKSGDPYHIFLTTYFIGAFAYGHQLIELSATLLLKAEEINKQLDYKTPHQKYIWPELGEVLFHTREYESCIVYLKKGIASQDRNRAISFFYIKDLNTIGQAYQQLHQLDSAMVYYRQSLEAGRYSKDYEKNKIWEAINYGFIGQVFFAKGNLDSAKVYLERDYNFNKDYAKNVAAYSLQWLAKIHLQKNDKAAALKAVKEALHLLETSGEYTIQRANYLQHVYLTTADVYRAYKNTDSLYHYLNLYLNIHDALEKLAFKTNSDILQTRMDNEKNYLQIANLEKEKKAAIQKRNFIILFIALVAIIALLHLNKLRVRHQHKEQLALQEKKIGEVLAKEQLASVKQNLIDKVELIEKLQEQLNYHQNSVEKQELASAIAGITILTEDDWDRFKTLFEKMHPAFFMKLQERVKDITAAELRMAALTRLQLSTHQIASILGISANSVYKTKQRLRQRLNLDPEISMEEKILTI